MKFTIDWLKQHLDTNLNDKEFWFQNIFSQFFPYTFLITL